MNRLAFTLFFVVIFTFANAQVEKHQRVKVYTPSSKEVNLLASKGLTHGRFISKPEPHYFAEYSESELNIIKHAGLRYDVIIDDMTKFYQQRNVRFCVDSINASIKSKQRSIKGYMSPSNFKLGSMGGFHTYQELLNELDEMKDLYPDLISTKQPIGATNSIEGRPVYWVRISSNPEVDQDKPQVLYTALTHAREPASMQQMLYQMWYLLENYENDPEIKYLVNNLELFFIPCVNPDGYLYNQFINPEGGGMWRKNRRENSGGSFGVDLNRNFGYKWGYDDMGSSPYGTSNVYRGTSGFSEPETHLVKQFCEERNIILALNNHTYSDLLIYPWGYDSSLTPDSEIFINYAQFLTSENEYVYGTCYETLAYFANGVSDDWFYGEQETKNKIFAFTPEAGSPEDGFWPQVNRIEEICAGHTGMNLYLARLALPFAKIYDRSELFFDNTEVKLPLIIKSFGQYNPSNFTISITPLSANIQTVSDPVEFSDMQVLEERKDTLALFLDSSILHGDKIEYIVSLNNGFFTYSDTITKTYGFKEMIISDSCDDMYNWESNNWNNTTQYYFSKPSSINDSPGTNYQNNANTRIILKDEIDLTDASHAYVEFMARWDIEKDWDFTQFMASLDHGDTWVPLHGEHTVPGQATQDPNKPLYHGHQGQWVREVVDLSEFIGENIMLSFRLVSDILTTGKGFFFDDFRVEKLFADPSPMLTLPQKLKFLQGETLTINIKEYIKNHTQDIALEWDGNELIEIIQDNWSITFSPIDEEWVGSEHVTFSISNGYGEHSKTITIECVEPKNPPVITGQNEVYTYKNEPLDITFDHLIVEDDDNAYPEDYTLTVYQGENYTLNNLTVIPSTNYVGTLSVPVSVFDGFNESNVFELEVEVRIPLGIEPISQSDVNIYFDATTSMLVINNNSSHSFNQIDIIDLQGRIITSRKVAITQGKYQIMLPRYAQGVYVVRLLGDTIVVRKTFM